MDIKSVIESLRAALGGQRRPPAQEEAGGAAADPLSLAARYLGRHARELKRAKGDVVGDAMQDWVPDHLGCANFVSGVLIASGRLPRRKGSAGVLKLVENLKADPRWRQIPLADAEPGDVLAMKTDIGQHVELVARRGPDGLELIGSNNVLSDGTQAVCYEPYVGNPIIAVMRFVG